MPDTWTWQGRQEHGWFGHGTAPDTIDAEEGGADATPAASAEPHRVATAAQAAVAALPLAARAAFEAELSAATLDRMQALFDAWARQRTATPDSFARRYLDGAVPATAGVALRDAARLLAGPSVEETPRGAAARIASAAKVLGAGRFARAISALAERAAAHVDDNPRRWLGQASVGSGHCVPLVQAATGAPRTSLWRLGPQVQGNLNIAPGTAIATFDPDGSYGNHTDGSSHAAIYLGQTAAGITVIDQWIVRHRDGSVTRRAPAIRTIAFGAPGRPAVDRGEAYHVVR